MKEDEAQRVLHSIFLRLFILHVRVNKIKTGLSLTPKTYHPSHGNYTQRDGQHRGVTRLPLVNVFLLCIPIDKELKKKKKKRSFGSKRVVCSAWRAGAKIKTYSSEQESG